MVNVSYSCCIVQSYTQVVDEPYIAIPPFFQLLAPLALPPLAVPYNAVPPLPPLPDFVLAKPQFIVLQLAPLPPLAEPITAIPPLPPLPSFELPKFSTLKEPPLPPLAELLAAAIPFFPFVDESSWWEPNETQNVLDMIQGYWPKFNMWTLLASSPSQPGDLMDTIFKQDESETAWYRLKMDWKYAENLLYTKADIEHIRKTSSWGREMELRWSSKAGSTFNQFDIERAKAIYDLNPICNERTLAIDPASGTTGVCVVEERDGDIYVLRAEEVVRATHESLSDYVYQLHHDYAPIAKLYIDNSAVTFVKTVKEILGEPQDYMEQIKLYKHMHASYELNMRCEPVFFSVQTKREMLEMLKQCMEEDRLKIYSKEHEKLLLFLYECSDQELIINKQQTAHNDSGDALQMCMRGYTK